MRVLSWKTEHLLLGVKQQQQQQEEEEAKQQNEEPLKKKGGGVGEEEPKMEDASLDFGDIGIGFGDDPHAEEDQDKKRQGKKQEDSSSSSSSSQQQQQQVENELRLKSELLEQANARMLQMQESKQMLLDQKRELEEKLQDAKASSERYQAQITQLQQELQTRERELVLARSESESNRTKCEEKDRQVCHHAWLAWLHSFGSAVYASPFSFFVEPELAGGHSKNEGRTDEKQCKVPKGVKGNQRAESEEEATRGKVKVGWCRINRGYSYGSSRKLANTG